MQFIFLADRPEFIPTVAAWNYNQWGYAIEDNSYEKTLERLNGKLNRHQVPLPVIALEGEAIVASAQLKRYEIDYWPEREYWLGGVYVPEAKRGRGIAGALCHKMTEIAHNMGIGTLYLQTEKLDGGLYARLGWQSCEQILHHGLDVRIMKYNT